jgi:hypothetical protein
MIGVDLEDFWDEGIALFLLKIQRVMVSGQE